MYGNSMKIAMLYIQGFVVPVANIHADLSAVSHVAYLTHLISLSCSSLSLSRLQLQPINFNSTILNYH